MRKSKRNKYKKNKKKTKKGGFLEFLNIFNCPEDQAWTFGKLCSPVITPFGCCIQDPRKKNYLVEQEKKNINKFIYLKNLFIK